MPEIEQRQPIFTVQASDIPAPVGSHQTVVRLLAGRELFDFRMARVGRIHQPDLAAVEQTEHEASARCISQAYDFGSLPVIAIASRYLGE